MKFNTEFINDFEKHLQNHQTELKEIYKTIVLQNYDLGMYAGLNSYFSIKNPIRIERESLIPLVEKYFSVSVIEYFNNTYGFKIKLTQDYVNENNESLINDYNNIVEESAAYERKYISDFWLQNKHLNEDYLKLSFFEPLELISVEKEKAFGKFVARGYTNINVENWIEYIKRIFCYCLPAYEIDYKSDKNVFRIFKKISDDYNVGIEFPLNITKSYFRKGNLSVEYISVFIFNNEFQRKSKGYNGYEINDENLFTILDLELSTRIGQIGNMQVAFMKNYEYEVIEEEETTTLKAKYFNEDYVKRYCFMYFVTMLKTQEPIINFFIDKFLELKNENLPQ